MMSARALVTGWAINWWRYIDGLSGNVACANSDQPPQRTKVDNQNALPYRDEFDAFFRTYREDVFSYLWRFSGEEQSALDLTQDTFLWAWQHFSTIHAYEQPRAWLFRVATNLALNHVGRRFRVRNTSLSFVALGFEALNEVDPAVQVVEADLIRQTLLKLHRRERAALILHAVYGLSCAELASALSISLANAKTTLWRGRERFRAQYVREGVRK